MKGSRGKAGNGVCLRLDLRCGTRGEGGSGIGISGRENSMRGRVEGASSWAIGKGQGVSSCYIYVTLFKKFIFFRGFPGGSMVNNPPANAGNVGDTG